MEQEEETKDTTLLNDSFDEDVNAFDSDEDENDADNAVAKMQQQAVGNQMQGVLGLMLRKQKTMLQTARKKNQDPISQKLNVALATLK